MFFRRHLTGRFGIPKHSDNEESPFEPREIDMLRSVFREVHLHYGEFRFLSIMSEYLFRHKIDRPCKAVDNWLFSHCPFLLRYSYRQIVEVLR